MNFTFTRFIHTCHLLIFIEMLLDPRFIVRLSLHYTYGVHFDTINRLMYIQYSKKIHKDKHYVTICHFRSFHCVTLIQESSTTTSNERKTFLKLELTSHLKWYFLLSVHLSPRSTKLTCAEQVFFLLSGSENIALYVCAHSVI